MPYIFPIQIWMKGRHKFQHAGEDFYVITETKITVNSLHGHVILHAMSSVGCSLRWETFACMMQVFPAGKQCQGSFLQWRQFVLMMDVMAGMVAGENAHGLMILG